MSESNRLFERGVAFGFRQLYTRLAWSYDLVAAGVSFGEWPAWGRCAIPFLRGRRVLELAHGPGHLHLALHQRGYSAAGIDLSAQMGALAGARLRRAGHDGTLVRAEAQRLPFPDGIFDSVVCTFPTRFIFDTGTLREARRVLGPDGVMVIVPSAILHVAGIAAQWAKGLRRARAQRRAGRRPVALLFEREGFHWDEQIVATRLADVTVWVCQRQ